MDTRAALREAVVRVLTVEGFSIRQLRVLMEKIDKEWQKIEMADTATQEKGGQEG
jgi:hypothetical protein